MDGLILAAGKNRPGENDSTGAFQLAANQFERSTVSRRRRFSSTTAARRRANTPRFGSGCSKLFERVAAARPGTRWPSSVTGGAMPSGRRA